MLDHRHVVPGVRFAVDAYVNFARTRPWPEAVASSLTELFAPDLMAKRLEAFRRFYPWVDSAGLDYFASRLLQAPRDSGEALKLTLDHCDTREKQQAALCALQFKCDLLWAMLDAIHGRCLALTVPPRRGVHARQSVNTSNPNPIPGSKGDRPK
jgi:pyrroloquinoline-quinone synthase